MPQSLHHSGMTRKYQGIQEGEIILEKTWKGEEGPIHCLFKSVSPLSVWPEVATYQIWVVVYVRDCPL